MNKPKTPEGLVLGSVLDFLMAVQILSFRMNTGVAKFGPRTVRFGVPGMADILAFPGSRVLWIECKAKDGRQSFEQKMFQKIVEAAGHGYLLARSIDDVRDWLVKKPALAPVSETYQESLS